MKYLVTGSSGAGFSSPEEASSVLKNSVIPSFQMLIQYERDGVIQGGGVPVGDRALAFIIEASSNEELDRHLRMLPIWSVLEWEVTALQSFKGRMEIEQDVLRKL